MKIYTNRKSEDKRVITAAYDDDMTLDEIIYDILTNSPEEDLVYWYNHGAGDSGNTLYTMDEADSVFDYLYEEGMEDELEKVFSWNGFDPNDPDSKYFTFDSYGYPLNVYDVNFINAWDIADYMVELLDSDYGDNYDVKEFLREHNIQY